MDNILKNIEENSLIVKKNYESKTNIQGKLDNYPSSINYTKLTTSLSESFKILFKEIADNDYKNAYETLLKCKSVLATLENNNYCEDKNIITEVNKHINSFEKTIYEMVLIKDDHDTLTKMLKDDTFISQNFDQLAKFAITHNSTLCVDKIFCFDKYVTCFKDYVIFSVNEEKCLKTLLGHKKFKYTMDAGVLNKIIIKSIHNNDITILEDVFKINEYLSGCLNIQLFISFCNGKEKENSDICSIPKEKMTGCIKVLRFLLLNMKLNLLTNYVDTIQKYLVPENFEFVKEIVSHSSFMKHILVDGIYDETIARERNHKLYKYLDEHEFDYAKLFDNYYFNTINDVALYMVRNNMKTLTVQLDENKSNVVFEKSVAVQIESAIKFLKSKNISKITISSLTKYVITYNEESVEF